MFIKKTLAFNFSKNPPIWLMRQAGRYLPEYLILRAQFKNFLEFCLTPEAAFEASLQPIHRFDFDAVIVFSDILLIPYALDQHLKYKENLGPQLFPSFDKNFLEQCLLKKEEDFLNKLDPVYKTIKKLKFSCVDKAIIGFVGAPWTLSCYMIQGYSPNFHKIKSFINSHEVFFKNFIDKISNFIFYHVKAQIDAGVNVVQIFDTWSGLLNLAEFQEFCIFPLKNLSKRIKNYAPECTLIFYGKGDGIFYKTLSQEAYFDVISFDSNIDPMWIKKEIKDVIFQGNLSPKSLLLGGYLMEEKVNYILDSWKDKNFIFNLGHGILKETPISNVYKLIELVRRK